MSIDIRISVGQSSGGAWVRTSMVGDIPALLILRGKGEHGYILHSGATR